MSIIKPEFDMRSVKILAISVDTIDSHKGWIEHINETQKTKVNYPIIADPDLKISSLYDMVHPNSGQTATVRSVFIIGADKRIKLTITYPASTGRNFKEILRVLDSLKLTSDYEVSTPVNWQQGEDCVVVPSIPTKDIPGKFPKGLKEIKSYLRYTPQPNK